MHAGWKFLIVAITVYAIAATVWLLDMIKKVGPRVTPAMWDDVTGELKVGMWFIGITALLVIAFEGYQFFKRMDAKAP